MEQDILTASNLMTNKVGIVTFIEQDFSIEYLEHPFWQKARPIKVVNFWSGKLAPSSASFESRLLWSDNYLYVLFVAKQMDPPVIKTQPILDKKAIGLWERDVCELFITPNKNNLRRYYEFEVAPTGEWLDLAIEQLLTQRITDWEYKSNMQSAARIDKQKVVMAFRVSWQALEAKPTNGDFWYGNIFRAMGSEPNRLYLSWSATETPEPDFHVPEKFAKFVFRK